LKKWILGVQVLMVLIDLYPAQAPRGLFKAKFGVVFGENWGTYLPIR
jgi:hypothetical protein